jgi:hypothetical protein
MRLKDRGEQPAMTAADIGDAADAREIERLYDRAGSAKVSLAR